MLSSVSKILYARLFKLFAKQPARRRGKRVGIEALEARWNPAELWWMGLDGAFPGVKESWWNAAAQETKPDANSDLIFDPNKVFDLGGGMTKNASSEKPGDFGALTAKSFTMRNYNKKVILAGDLTVTVGLNLGSGELESDGGKVVVTDKDAVVKYTGGKWSANIELGVAGSANKPTMIIETSTTAVLTGSTPVYGILVWKGAKDIEFGAGGILIGNGGVFDMLSTGTLKGPVAGLNGLFANVRGTVRKSSTGVTTVALPFENRIGKLEVFAGTLKFTNVLQQTRDTASTILAGGTLVAAQGFNLDAGSFEGEGELTGDVICKAATILPGRNGTPGNLNIVGDLSTNADSRVLIRALNNAASTTQGFASRLYVSGNVTLAGTLEVERAPAFKPTNSAIKYDIVKWGGVRAGTFAKTVYTNINLWEIPGRSFHTILSPAADAYQLYPRLAPVIKRGAWLDNNIKNGKRDAGEGVAANVPVDLLDAQGTVLASTTTDANGEYEFTAEGDRSYSVRFHAPAGYIFSPRDQGTDDTIDSDVFATGYSPVFAVSYDGSDILPDAGLVFAGSGEAELTGRVWIDSDNDGVQDFDGFGVAGVVVHLRDADGNVIASTYTDQDGNYSFLVGPGFYSVAFVPPPDSLGFTLKDAAADFEDSDVDAAGLSDLFFLAGNTGLDLDAGVRYA